MTKIFHVTQRARKKKLEVFQMFAAAESLIDLAIISLQNFSKPMLKILKINTFNKIIWLLPNSKHLF